MSLVHKNHAESHMIECKPIVPDNLIEQEKAEEPKEDEEEEEVTGDLVTTTTTTEEAIATEEVDEKDMLLSLISDLTVQINELRAQITPKDVNFYTLDKDGKIIPGKEMQTILKKVKRPESQDQQDNKDAYHQKYHE